MNNPLTRIDPTGMISFRVLEASIAHSYTSDEREVRVYPYGESDTRIQTERAEKVQSLNTALSLFSWGSYMSDMAGIANSSNSKELVVNMLGIIAGEAAGKLIKMIPTTRTNASVDINFKKSTSVDPGYHTRVVNGKTIIARNPGKAATLPKVDAFITPEFVTKYSKSNLKAGDIDISDLISVKYSISVQC